MERARELAERYVGEEGVVGIYVVGSSTRPFRDELSDYDIEVVVEDATYARLGDEAKHVLVFDDGPPRRVDHEFYLWPWSAFEALPGSRLDLFHYPYQHVTVLHDPDGRVGEIVRAAKALPEAVRQERLRVHYLELAFGAGRARRTWQRDEHFSARLVVGEALRAAVKLAFLTKGSWPSTLHWSEQELRILGVPEPVLARLREAAGEPEPPKLADLKEAMEAWMEEEAVSVHQDPAALMHWAFLTSEGKAAFERWSTG